MNNKKTLIGLAIFLVSGLIGWWLTSSHYSMSPDEYPLPKPEIVESPVKETN